jgi:predicted ATPase
VAHFEGKRAEVERLALDLIELSVRQSFAIWQPIGAVLRGWARSASGDTAAGLAWIEDGIEDWRATGAVLAVPYYLVCRLTYNDDVAAGQLAVFQGASDEHPPRRT